MKKQFFLYTCFSIAFAVSCSFDYSSSELADALDDDLPQAEMLNAIIVVERDTVLEMKIDRLSSFDKQGFDELVGVEFREYGHDGEIRVEGSAERGRRFFDTNDVEFTGFVRIYSRVDEAELRTRYLYWDDERKFLLGSEDDMVTIRKDDGSWVQGIGLKVNGKQNLVEMTAGVDGVFQEAETTE